MTLAEIGAMSRSEYAGWVEYAQVEPFGPYIDDLRVAQVVAAIYNVNRDSGKQPEPYAPSKFARWNTFHRRQAEPQMPLVEADANAQSEAILKAMGYMKE
jgi:hypothetical protein